MRLTHDQIAARVDKDADFADWYVEDVMRNHFPQDYWDLSEEGKREMVLNGRAQARQFGFTRNQSQARFVTLMLLIAPNFHVQPGYRDALADPALSEDARLDLCFDMDKDRAVDAIRQADALYWFPDMLRRREDRRA
ncbi:MAG: hypothetical protein AB8B60_05085 [Sulfitobacter sp.]